jgi:hypothetical protein
MCVSNSMVTSLMAIPASDSWRRRDGSALLGPGSIKATPPGPCRTAVAMMRGTC